VPPLLIAPSGPQATTLAKKITGLMQRAADFCNKIDPQQTSVIFCLPLNCGLPKVILNHI